MVDSLPVTTNGEETPEQAEWRAIQAAYAEVARRDTSLEKRLWYSHCREVALVGCCAVLVASLVALVLLRRKVQAFVQVVQVNDEGRVVQQGLPQDLLSYTPTNAQWLDLLAPWIRKMRWRGVDTVLTREEWKWLYLHTCGDARQLLQHWEETEKPFTLGKVQTSVVLKSITKTPAPLSYQALWEEVSTSGTQPPTIKRWAGTFTVGRFQPPDQAALLQNRLGLCVTAFDISPQP